MSEQNQLRIGFIGAGAICRSRHLPGLAQLDGVEVVAVANRTRESGQNIAADFGIPDVLDSWQDLLARDDIDAVFIGTWPYMHRELSVAVLESGKHCFCQARMTMNLAEAKAMLDCATAHRDLVNMICPPPTRMPFEPFIKDVLAKGQLGQLTAVQLISVGSGNRDLESVHWRERAELSGKQVLAMGIYAETMHAILGPYVSLTAQTSIPLVEKAGVKIDVPQVVTLSGQLENGALCTEIHHGLAADKSTLKDQLTIWGMDGTLHYEFGDTIQMAAAGEPLQPVDVPADLQRGWCVEEDFVNAVRAARVGGAWHVSPDFAEGLLYMRKVEAVHESASTGRAVKPAEL